MTLRQLADEIGIHENSLARHQNGPRNPHRIFSPPLPPQAMPENPATPQRRLGGGGITEKKARRASGVRGSLAGLGARASYPKRGRSDDSRRPGFHSNKILDARCSLSSARGKRPRAFQRV